MNKFVPEEEGRSVVNTYHGKDYVICKRIETLAELYSAPDHSTHALIGHTSISHEILKRLPPACYMIAFEHGYAFWGTHKSQE